MSSLTGIFKAAPEPPQQDTDKLVDLFRNRVELKKEFAALRDEKYRLQDRIKEHRASIDRVEQKLKHLEALLLDPEWVHNVVTFYQLRRLAAHLRSRVGKFAEQLKQQREKRVHDQVLGVWQKEQAQVRASLEAEIREQRMQLQMRQDQLQAERRRLETMGGLSRMLKGKEQSQAIDDLERSVAEAQSRESELLYELERIEQAEAPPNPGLDIAAKRSINFLILSFAQQLYLCYHEDNLAAMAKEAGEKSVGAVNYGDKVECDEILERLAKRREEVENLDNSTETLQRRAKLIAEQATFRSDDDAIPASGSVATVFDISSNGVVSQLDANLLGENYFGLSKALSR